MSQMSGISLLRLEDIESDADYVLYSSSEGVLSEHYTEGEARMAYFQEASRHNLGDHLPLIFERQENAWAPLH